MVLIGAGCGLLAFVVLICFCCCLSDMVTAGKNDNPCCKCCANSENDNEDGSTYKKAPLDGDVSSTLINQPFQGFSSMSKSNPHSGLMNNMSNYEYYDNTSTGLLTETYSRNNKSNNRLIKKSSSYEGTEDNDENYSQEDDDEDMGDHEHYMNSSNRKLKSVNVYGEESSEEESSSGGTTSSSSDHKSYEKNYSQYNTNGPKKISYSTNNDVMENYQRSLQVKNSQPNQNNQYTSHTNNYSTIDSKKFIKTDNGLVYTPLNGGILKKSNVDNHKEEEILNDDLHLDSKYRLEESNYEDLRNNQYNNRNKISGTYSNVKKSTTNKMPMTNKALFGVPQPIQPDNFKNELNLKLKSFNHNNIKQLEQISPATKLQHFQLEQISTATTSLSSASSCTSNSELVKENNCNHNKYKLAPLATNLTSESLVSAATDILPNNNNNTTSNTYSLLKTTLNVKGASETLESSLAMSQLRKSQNNNSKPPILKPKPRTNTLSNNNNMNNSTFDNSIHNQSGDPLLISSNFKETSLHTSPSTSVTDVSSNNLTPQHNNGNLNIDEITSAQIDNLVKPNANFQRNNNYNQQSQRGQNAIHKATTTFGSNPCADGLIYSTTKTNGNANGDLTVRTYDSTTLNRKQGSNKNQLSIDEEISQAQVKKANGNSQSRTLERRKIQNSEC